MKIYSLGSSSSGNCTYIEENGDGVLIDAGFGVRNTCNFLKEAKIDENNVRAIFITHEHTDHICGLKSLCKRWDVPVYGSRATLEKLLEKDAVGADTKLYEINLKTAEIGSLAVSAFHTPHDSADSLGFIVSNGKVNAGICTDLGYMPTKISKALENCNFVLLESNYDTAMLQAGNYPFQLKERIASNYGHLSNDDCAVQVGKLIERGTTHFLLGHLSQDNNRPDIADSTVQSHLLGYTRGRDYLNNVELAEAAAAPGKWRAEVRAATMGEGPQRLSLAGNVTFGCDDP